MKQREVIFGKNKHAVSPVITTVLLVLIVLVLASVIVLWGFTFIPEALSKFNRPIEDACSNVKLSVDLDTFAGELSVVNTGDVHVYKIGLRKTSPAKTEIENREANISPGGSKIFDVDISGLSQIEVIPILLGKTEKREKVQEFPCSEISWQVVKI